VILKILFKAADDMLKCFCFGMMPLFFFFFIQTTCDASHSYLALGSVGSDLVYRWPSTSAGIL
jgi:hypothetical protein